LRNRLAVYHENTAPLLPFYKAKGKLRTIDGMNSIEDVLPTAASDARSSFLPGATSAIPLCADRQWPSVAVDSGGAAFGFKCTAVPAM